MVDITLKHFISLQDIHSKFGLEGYHIADLSIGNDDNIYILFSDSSHEAESCFYKAVVLTLDWQTGQMVYDSLLDFGKLDRGIDFVQPINNDYLLVKSRARFYNKYTYDNNAFILDEMGKLKSEMCFGDGIEQCIVDGNNRIITSYFDEGVFGNYGWINPIGKGGLIAWSLKGEKIWGNKEHDIVDCYAINIDSLDRLWYYYYTKFNLVETNYREETEYEPEVEYASGFLLNRKMTSVIFLNGIKKGHNNGCFKVTLNGNKISKTEECRLIDVGGREIEFYDFGLRKYKGVFLDRNKQLYSTEID